jgi:hypothetical protein
MIDTTEDEENQTYAAFIKAFAPVLLHLATDNAPIIRIIKKFQTLPEESAPNREDARILRDWVDSKEPDIDALTADEINHITETYRLRRIETKQIHKNAYKLHSKGSKEMCLITMEPIKRGEYYVDFLDGGKPYKVAGIVEYYKRLKLINRADWKSPLRNPITEEQAKLLEDLMLWYDSPKMCTRHSRKRTRSPSSARSRSRSPGSRNGGSRKTRKMRKTKK